MARLQQFAGGAFGAGGTIALRETLDTPGQSAFRQPSTIFGLGTGLAAAGLYLGHRVGAVDTPVLDQDFWGAHALTALPTGLLFSQVPKERGETTTEQLVSEFNKLVGRGGTGGMGGNGGGGTGSEGVRVQRVQGNGRGGRSQQMSRPR
jgi:hypothetical protein